MRRKRRRGERREAPEELRMRGFWRKRVFSMPTELSAKGCVLSWRGLGFCWPAGILSAAGVPVRSWSKMGHFWFLCFGLRVRVGHRVLRVRVVLGSGTCGTCGTSGTWAVEHREHREQVEHPPKTQKKNILIDLNSKIFPRPTTYPKINSGP